VSSAAFQRRAFEGALYGGQHTVSVMPGDGIGKEMTTHALTVLEATKAPIYFDVCDFDQKNSSEEDYNRLLLSFKRNKIALKGSLEGDFKDPQFKSYNALLRRDLNLFFNVVHVTCDGQEGVPAFDTVIIRQNISGEYSLVEHSPVEGVVEYMKVITRKETEVLARYAFRHALFHGRKRLTCVHKANIQKQSDGLFLATVREVAKEFPAIAFDDMIVDNTAMQLVSNPGQFDVILTTNLYGSICTNIACGLAGGAGLFSGVNISEEVRVFEPANRSTGMRIVENVGNPTAMINASVEMLKYLRLDKHAGMIERALHKTTVEEGIRTRDAGGSAKSSEVVGSILHHIQHDNLF